MLAYKFSDCARDVKPDTATTRLLEKAMDRAILTREEKNRIAEVCYGVGGSNSASYRLAGWQWDVWAGLRIYIVDFTYDHLQYFYAADKTALRSVLRSVRRIIDVEKGTG